MAKKKKEMGVCCICGKFGELSFEHVPPKAAYNKDTIIEYQWEDVIRKRKVKPKVVQGGVGAFTLCQSCNNLTGSWYGGEYAKWAKTCHDLITLNSKKITGDVVTINNVYPLRFLKQVVACFMSVIGSRTNGHFLKKHPEFTTFLLDKQNNELPYNFRFFLSLSTSSEVRRLPILHKIEVNRLSLNVLSTMKLSEIIHLPLHLIMTLDDKVIESSTEITVFKSFGYDEKTNIEIPLYVNTFKVPLPKFP
ncbi:MAG: hypothetical protein MUF38_02505 [Anaerolineae bacterium]|nr:hypothetical protein [Anaerolineae bacterium]